LDLNRKKAANEKSIWESGCHDNTVWSSWIAHALFRDKWQLLAKSIGGLTDTHAYAPAEPLARFQSLGDTDTGAGTRACT